MKNIVIDAREIKTSSGRYVEKLISNLQDVDKVNNYNLLLKPNDYENWKPKSFNFRGVVCNYKEFTFGEQLGLRNQINKLRPDLMHFTFTQQPILYRRKAVTTVHDLTTIRFTNPDKKIVIFKLKQFVLKRVIKRVANKSSHIITPSKFVKEDLISFTNINPEKISVIYEAADAITDRSEPLLDLEDKNFIMYIGRPTPHKNLSRLIEAFVLLKKQRPNLCLVLSGKEDSNYRRIKQDVESRLIKDVVFTGFVSEGSLRWLYENCRAYIFPSLSEGFGLPGLEAMTHGAPVVSSSATCLPEIYGDSAHYFDPLDVKDMANSISEVLDNQDLRNSYINKGRLQSKKYSWRKTALQTLDIYNEVLEP
jgi:glycosyltransferase involved in cell wall biosynthesis